MQTGAHSEERTYLILVTDDERNARTQAASGRYAIVIFIHPAVGEGEITYSSDETAITTLGEKSCLERCQSFSCGIAAFESAIGEASLLGQLDMLLGNTSVRRDFLSEPPPSDDDCTGQSFLI